MIDTILHHFFYFLGTIEGEFFYKSIEFIIYLIISYMIISEYLKSKEQEQKILIFAFLALAAQKFIMVAVLGLTIFAEYSTPLVHFYLPIFDDFLEMFALILLANAFLYPIMKERKEKWSQYLERELLILIFVSFIIEIFWIFSIRRNSALEYQQFLGSPLFDLLNIIILLIPVYFWLFFPPQNSKYRLNIILAFMVYMAYPVLNLINFVFYNGTSIRLYVAEHPFPLLAVLLFTRVVYQKLVDKAVLKEKLRESEKKYLLEKEMGRMKDEFISTVSHELRTPLTSMKLYISLLGNGEFGPIAQRQKEAISTINEESDRLAILIEDLLNLSKLDSKKVKLNLEKIDLSSIIDNDMYDKMAAEKNLVIIKKVPVPFPVWVDSKRFKQVYLNLFSNAVKFTDNGSITISAKNKDGKLHLSITDTGIGIPKDKLPKLFEKFYQADDFMTRSQGGTGLGLVIAKKIIELHKGKITVSSVEGKGSTFTVIIPKYSKKKQA